MSYYKNKKIKRQSLGFVTASVVQKDGNTSIAMNVPFDVEDFLVENYKGKVEIEWERLRSVVEEYHNGEQTDPDKYASRIGAMYFTPSSKIEDVISDAMAQFGDFTDDKSEDEELEFDEGVFDEIILSNKMKNKIVETVNQVKHRDLIFNEWGMFKGQDRGQGINLLFAGDPGTGKTYCAEVIAKYLGWKIEFVSMSSIKSKWVGESEKNIRSILMEAKNKVIIIDEIDSLAVDRDQIDQDHGVNLVNEFLIWLERHNNVVIMTTNREDKLDAAFKRRIDLTMRFTTPNEKERESIWKLFLSNNMPKDKIDYKKLAEYELTGANIKEIIKSSARKLAFAIKVRNIKKNLDTKMLIEEIEYFKGSK